jgi:DNA-binding NarL/FixJ family response regulator
VEVLLGRIAVIDDVKICRTPLKNALQVAGHIVDEPEPSCVFDLMSALRRDLPDLFITDIEMPGCSGVSLIRMLREDPVLGQVPILVVSVHHDESMVAGLSQLNIQGFLIKPVDLQRTIREATTIMGRQGTTYATEAP